MFVLTTLVLPFIYASLCTLIFLSPILVPEYMRRKQQKKKVIYTRKLNNADVIIDVDAKVVTTPNTTSRDNISFGFSTGLF
jgi:hypothetical protein